MNPMRNVMEMGRSCLHVNWSKYLISQSDPVHDLQSAATSANTSVHIGGPQCRLTACSLSASPVNLSEY